MGRNIWLCALASAHLLGVPAMALAQPVGGNSDARSWGPLPDWRCEQDHFDDSGRVVCWEHQFLSDSLRQRFSPSMELRETRDAFVLIADVPGLDEKDLEVTLNGNRLVIRGQRPEPKPSADEKYFARERGFGSFERSFALPGIADGDRIDAKVEKGVLTLRIPKKASQASKRITVRGSSEPERPSLGENP
jgi:HSP20 family protein